MDDDELFEVFQSPAPRRDVISGASLPLLVVRVCTSPALTMPINPGSASSKPKALAEIVHIPTNVVSAARSREETSSNALRKLDVQPLFEARFGNVPPESRRDLDQYMQLVVSTNAEK